MKKTILALSFATLSAALSAATVESVIVRQMWPWSTDIKVEYQLSGVDASHPVDISVRAFNGGIEIGAGTLSAALSGQRYAVTDCVGTFTIDPTIAFGSSTIALGNFTVQLSVSESDPKMNDILYKIVDLDAPYTVTDVRRHDFYDGKYGSFVTSFQDIDSTFSTSLDDVLIWLDVTNDVYKTDKMVFRRIPAAGKSYKMLQGDSSVNDGAGVEVSFTKDFYIGVYEVTQTQMNKFYRYFGAGYDYSAFPNAPGSGHVGCNSYETNELYRAMRPATGMQFDNSNGTLLRRCDQSLTDHTKVGPAKSGTARGTLCYNMQDKTGLLVDLPTEAMWEYACRAGTTNALYSGKAYSLAEAQKLSRMNKWDGTMADKRNADLSYMSNIVGSYKPNAWGLYDMIGNASEWCLDKYQAAGNLSGGEDPVSTTYGTDGYHVQRGGGFTMDNENHVVTYRIGRHKDWYWSSTGGQSHGARLCIYLDNNDNGTL